MIAAHSSVQEAAGMAGETWDLTASRGKGGKKAENDPLHLKGVMFLACPPCPHSASFPPSYTHINEAKEDFELCSSWKQAGEPTAL